MKKIVWTILIVDVLVVTLLLYMVAGQPKGPSKEPDFVFLVPNGFRGFITMRTRHRGGRQLQVKDDTIWIEVPANGKLDIRHALPHPSWERIHARYVSGEEIPVVRKEGEIPADQVGLRLYPGEDRWGVYLFVGTAAEAGEGRAARSKSLNTAVPAPLPAAAGKSQAP